MKVWVGGKGELVKIFLRDFSLKIFFVPSKKIFKISTKLDDLSNKNKSTKITIFKYRLKKKFITYLNNNSKYYKKNYVFFVTNYSLKS